MAAPDTFRPMFPPTVDSTMLSTMRSCRYKYFRTYVEHWKPRGESVHLVAGGAFAKGIEVTRRAFYEDGRDEETALALGLGELIRKYGDFQCPPDSAKSLERTAGALEYYFSQYPLSEDAATPAFAADGRRMIEFSFAEPLPVLHPVTGQPILYTGRADMIADFAGGLYTTDEKTTSSLGASWSKQWDLRSQFTGYTWAARRRGIDVKGTLVRGISILKTKYDTQQVLTYRSDYQIRRWLQQVIYDVQEAIRCWESGYWDYNLDHSCNEYGGCSLRQVCASDNPEIWLPMNFVKRVWDPLDREELSVADWERKWDYVRPVGAPPAEETIGGEFNPDPSEEVLLDIPMNQVTR